MEKISTPTTTCKPAYARYVLIILTLTYTCSYIDRYILSVLVEPIKAELGVSDTAMGFLGGFAFALLYTIAGIPIARWADRGNRRNIIAAGVAVWSLMTVACGMVKSFSHLVIARVGVGIGEAAGTPPSHSLLADYFPPEKRATTLSIYSMGIPFGVMFGFLAGGWIAHFFDWRMAFILVGAPGLLLALIVRFTITEPVRGSLEANTRSNREYTVRQTLGFIASNPALLLMQIAGCFFVVGGIGLSYWIAPFFGRVHKLPLNEIATWLALGAFIGGVGGSYLAGRIADAMGRTHMKWYFLTPMFALLFGIPMTLWMLTTSNTYLALALFFVQQCCFSSYAGPVYAVMQFLIPNNMRAMAVSVHLFILNLVGLGLGPLLIGIMNDGLNPIVGEAGAITLSLVTVTLLALVAVACFWKISTLPLDSLIHKAKSPP
jgi:predicted MFS family arabinose efflux permease